MAPPAASSSVVLLGILGEQPVETVRVRRVADRISQPAQAETCVGCLGFTESEGSSILEHLLRGGDLTAWGLGDAVSRTAKGKGGSASPRNPSRLAQRTTPGVLPGLVLPLNERPRVRPLLKRYGESTSSSAVTRTHVSKQPSAVRHSPRAQPALTRSAV